MSYSVQLGALMVLIDTQYTFDTRSYPSITPANRQLFAVRHSALHMSKATAAVAAEAEKGDHGRAMDEAKLKAAVTKQFINTLKLAAELGITEADIHAAVADFWS